MNVRAEGPSKFGSCLRAQNFDARDAAVQEVKGITYAFDKAEKKPNAAEDRYRVTQFKQDRGTVV